MNNNEKEVMERFEKFDFDKGNVEQKAIYNKVTSPAPKKAGPHRKLAFAAAFCVIILAGAFFYNTMLPELGEPMKGQPLGGVEKLEERKEIIAQAPPQPVHVSEVKSQPQVVQREYELSEIRARAAVSAEQHAVQERVYRAPTKSLRANKIPAVARSVMAFDTSDAPAPVKGMAYSRGAVATEEIYRRPYFTHIPVQPIPAEMDYDGMKAESFAKYAENSFFSTATDPLSTFSSDVDTASYSFVKNAIQRGRSVNADAVRIEEFINYFDYSYPQPKGKDPVSINFEYTDSAWNEGLKLVKIGVKAKDIEKASLPASNLVFLIDVSGSMSGETRLPLVKKALSMLVAELRPEDKVSIVTYANGVNEVISGVKGNEKEKILNAVDGLHASGGTSGSAGLEKAYEVAKKNFERKGNNRVILATDGDFNIGPRSNSELENQIVKAKDSGIFLSILGFGMGNYKDDKVQTLANKGNGNYAYINDLLEARKVLVKEFGATLFTVAKDVKIQVEFNPAKVAAYRLVGYEKRKLENQDFNDDTKDAAEMGAGHTVTVLYEIIPVGVKSEFAPDIDDLKYGKTSGKDSGEVLTVKLRYKDPDSDKSKLLAQELKENRYVAFDKSSEDTRFAASVAQFGQILKNSQYKGTMSLEDVLNTAKKAKGTDEEGYRAEFIRLVDLYK